MICLFRISSLSYECDIFSEHLNQLHVCACLTLLLLALFTLQKFSLFLLFVLILHVGCFPAILKGLVTICFIEE